MNTFDDITCEEYFSVYEEEAEMRAWIEAMEQDEVNRELRELAEEQ